MDPTHVNGSFHHKAEGRLRKSWHVHSCMGACRSSAIYYKVRLATITQGHCCRPNCQTPHTWSGELGADSWREVDSRSSVALGAVFHATVPTPFHGITTDGRQETKCASLGHQEVSVHPTSTSSWPFIPRWNSLPNILSLLRLPLLQPSDPQAESVAKARLWLPPGPAPRERSAWKLCQTCTQGHRNRGEFLQGKKSWRREGDPNCWETERPARTQEWARKTSHLGATATGNSSFPSAEQQGTAVSAGPVAVGWHLHQAGSGT